MDHGRIRTVSFYNILNNLKQNLIRLPQIRLEETLNSKEFIVYQVPKICADEIITTTDYKN